LNTGCTYLGCIDLVCRTLLPRGQLAPLMIFPVKIDLKRIVTHSA